MAGKSSSNSPGHGTRMMTMAVIPLAARACAGAMSDEGATTVRMDIRDAEEMASRMTATMAHEGGNREVEITGSEMTGTGGGMTGTGGGMTGTGEGAIGAEGQIGTTTARATGTQSARLLADRVAVSLLIPGGRSHVACPAPRPPPLCAGPGGHALRGRGPRNADGRERPRVALARAYIVTWTVTVRAAHASQHSGSALQCPPPKKQPPELPT